MNTCVVFFQVSSNSISHENLIQLTRYISVTVADVFQHSKARIENKTEKKNTQKNPTQHLTLTFDQNKQMWN